MKIVQGLIVFLTANCLNAFLLTTLKAETCIASVYSSRDSGGNRTASGIRLNDNELTAAHKTLPLRSLANVTNLNNGKLVQVKITDRGPYIKGRCIDLTKAAARAIGINGISRVKVD